MSGSEASSSKGAITRIFLDSVVEPGNAFELPPGEAHHILTVLRGRAGGTFEVVDAARRLFVAELREGREAMVVEEGSVTTAASTEIVLYQAVPKGRHMDLVVEKATELGVEGIVPLVTGRGVVGIKEGKTERWQRLAESAARQSLQLRVPEIGEPAPFAEAVREAGRRGILLHNGEGLPPLEEAITASRGSLFVGPEGGWSEKELEMAEEAGFAFAQLGPYRLRSETAGIVAVARTQAALERLAGEAERTEAL